jgi:site-specific DNA-cytosine methylase
VERIWERMERDPHARLRVGGDVTTTVDAHYYEGSDSHGQRTLVRVGSLYESGACAGRVYSTEGLACAPRSTAGGKGAKTGLYAVCPAPVLPPVSNAVDCDGYLREPGHHDSLATCRIRRLTPVECERLQGFPDGWTERGVDEGGNMVEISDTQRYRMMGNAVTVPVAEALGRSINAYTRVLGWA